MIGLRRSWQDSPLVVKSALTLALPLVLLLSLIGYALLLQQRISAADTRVRQALVIQNGIQALHTQTAEAATGVRGYLLTGREDFLQPYFGARTRLPETLATLKRSIRVPEVAAQLREVIALWTKKEAHLEFMRVHGRNLAPAELQAQLIESKIILDELRHAIITLSLRESEVVGSASQLARAQFKQALWGGIAAAALVLVGSLVAFYMLYAGVVGRMQRLVLQAENLTEGRPLDTPPAGRDEIGQLANRLHNISEQLARSVDEARAANQAKSQFLSRTSHELRTPLNAMLGYAQLIEADTRRPEHASEARYILQAGQHLLALIDELLEISRSESRETPLNLAPVALAPLVQEIAALFFHQAASRQVTLALDLVPDNLDAQADRQRLRQVAINLVSNAIKFNRPGGRVRISAARSADTVHLHVADDGPGLTAEQCARIFTAFERLDAEEAGIEGIGLGLAVSRQLAERMGGTLSVSSKPGEGSVFTLALPAATPAVEPAAIQRPGWHACTASCDTPTRTLLATVLARYPAWSFDICPAMPTELSPGAVPRLVFCCAAMDQRSFEAWRLVAEQHGARLVWLGTPPAWARTHANDCLPLPLEVGRLHKLLASLVP